jgi:hypothetical protein
MIKYKKKKNLKLIKIKGKKLKLKDYIVLRNASSKLLKK